MEQLPDLPNDRLQRIERLARLLDDAVVVPGTGYRFGLDAVLGLIPGAGDVVTAALAGYIIYEAKQLGLPRRTLARMVTNVLIDLGVGSIPIAGDLFDFAWKANRRNMRLLRSHLQRAAQKR